MSDRSKILVVDDIDRNRKLLADILDNQGYEVITAVNGVEALTQIEADDPDLLLLDVMMPGMNGYEVCRRIRQNTATAVLPVIMVTALEPGEERIKGLDAGADDFLTKPVNRAELLARVRSLLRIKNLFDTVEAQKAELAAWGKTLEQRVREQVEELDRLGRLRRFLSPQVADLVVSSGDDSCLKSHRRLITTVFCDLRGFTAFCDAAEPEEAIDILQSYHQAMGELIEYFAGTIDHRAGDGIMIIFNDPLPCEQPALRALKMALAMREKMSELMVRWSKFGYELGFGVGISLGYATLGMVGFEGRFDYTANGNAVNLAARLCDQARDGQILISQRLYAEVEELIATEFVADLSFKGFHRPMAVFNVLSLCNGD